MTSLEVLSNHTAASLVKRIRSSQTFFYPCASLNVCGFFSDLARGWPGTYASMPVRRDRMLAKYASTVGHRRSRFSNLTSSLPSVSDLGTEGDEQRACEHSNPGPEKEVAVPASYPAINSDESKPHAHE